MPFLIGLVSSSDKRKKSIYIFFKILVVEVKME